jgi:ubiquinone/menaquinone biosynthesis C-methylase UbiE
MSGTDAAARDVSPRGSWRKWIFAWTMARCTNRHEREIAERKRRLLGPLSGTVVEIGPGAGANFPYYARGIRWIGIEPNPFMRAYLERAARSADIDADLRDGSADRLDFADDSVDAVVSTLVLCSADRVDAALREIRRVLKLGGRFVFVEHVAATNGTSTRRWQDRLARFWGLLADGCQPNRETWRAIEAAGFREVQLEHFRVPIPLIGPHIAGVAIK